MIAALTCAAARVHTTPLAHSGNAHWGQAKSAIDVYPSIVDIPHEGCWQLRLETRGLKGTLVVEAFEP